jgi:hypothetical protein
MTSRLFPLLLTAAVLGCCSDCAVPEQDQQPSATPTATNESFTHIIANDAQYYLGGPQQARPPDGTLKAGVKVELVEDAGSYCRVRSEDGVEAYVATDSLKPVRAGQQD